MQILKCTMLYEMKNKIIKFPNTPINQLSNAQQVAMQMETEKNNVEENLEWLMKKPDWDKLPKLDNRTIEILALFGDVMKFSPEVSAKIISKLAEFIAREPIRNVDPLEEYLKWVENLETKLTKAI